MKKQVQQQQKYFNQLLWKFQKYISKLNRLSQLGKNKHRQSVILKHLEKLKEKMAQSIMQIKRTAALTCLGGVLLSNNIDAQIQFQIGIAEQIGSGVVYPDPELIDLDNDGDLDLLIGSWNYGTNNIQYSENIGTPTNPQYTTSSLNTFGINFPSSVYSSKITCADLDNDGDYDILSGEYYGTIYYFENTGTSTAPSFATGVANPFGISGSLGYEPSPAFSDIDDDGDLDVFIVTQSGTKYFENTGTASSPTFATPTTNPFNLVTSGYSYAMPQIVDMDGDGDFDIVMGGSGSSSLEYYENTGTSSAPNFAAPNSGITGVIEPNPIVSAPAVGDVNNDGYPDIIKGINTGGFKLYINNAIPSTISMNEKINLDPFDLNPNSSGNATWGFPSFIDLDGDNDLDLMVGRRDGEFDYFENIGTATAPVYVSPVLNPFGITKDANGATPTFADIDGDGDQDMITANNLSINPHLRYLENIGTATAPSFTTGVSANSVMSLPYPGTDPKPRFIDLDDDGDQDLFVAVRYGDFKYYENIGTATAPDYGFEQPNPFGLVNVGSTESDFSPTFTDLDGDGDQDLLVGLRNGDNLYYENTGTSMSPAFAVPVTNDFGLSNVASAFSMTSWNLPVFADVDGDGDDDVISALENVFYFYENVSQSGPCVVNIPDANFKAYLVGNGSINTNSNSEIECSEATAFTGLINAQNMSISDLTGIESFTNVTQLYCMGNSLTSLDVSANTALDKLYCYGNDLTTLDVSSNTSLTDLKCHDNLLTNLSLSSNILLTDLSCYGNSLSALDLSNNTNLDFVNVSGNQLTSLDLSLNTVLTSIECFQNQLISLNVKNGNNTIITDFYATSNPNLVCIQVDDAAYSATNWTNVDATASFNEDCSSIGVEEINSLEVSMIPNPTNGMVTITSDQQIASIKVYNLAGQLLFNSVNQNNIDVSDLPSGIYQLVILAENGVSSIEKLMKN